LGLLGLDKNLLDIDRGRIRRRRLRLAFDGSGSDTLRKYLPGVLQGPALQKAVELCRSEPNESELFVKLNDLMAETLTGAEYQRSLDLLETHLSKHDRDDSVFDEEEDRELIDGMLDRAAALLRSRGVGDDDIDEFRRVYRQFRADDNRRRRAGDAELLPRNGLSQDRRRWTAGDAAQARDVFDRRWPEAASAGTTRTSRTITRSGAPRTTGMVISFAGA
jgi:hypothetical protein